MNGSFQDSAKAADKDGRTAAKNVNPILKLLMIIVAVPVMLVRKSQQALARAVYEGDGGGFLQFLGVLFGLGAGIGTGYFFGWLQGSALATWLGLGVGACLLTYVYLWPLLYLCLVKNALRLAETLWDAVGFRRQKSWFSYLLMAVGYTAIVCGSVYLGYDVFSSTKAHVASHWGWFGFLGWPAGLIAGAVVGLLAGAVAWWALLGGEMVFIAMAAGVATVYGLQGATEDFLASHGVSLLFTWPVGAAEFVLVVGYLFPLTHAVFTHGLGWLADIVEKLNESVYGHAETASEYRKFFAQVVNLAGAFQLASVSFRLWDFLGLSNPAVNWGAGIISAYLMYALAVAFVSYVVLGQVLKSTSNKLVGVITALHALVFVYFAWLVHDLWFGIWGAIAAATIGYVITYYVLFPLFYAIVRFVTTVIPIYRLGQDLDALHGRIYDMIGRVVDEIGHAFEYTYRDQTQYRDLFLHASNLAATVTVFFGTLKLAASLGLATWLTWSLTILFTILAYLLVGKLLLKAGSALVGALVGLAAGVATGTIAYAHLPYGAWWIVLAVVIGLAGTTLTVVAIFPLLYVMLRALINLLRPEKWLTPFLVAIHSWSWDKFTGLWAQFVETYHDIESWFKPIWDSIASTWNDTWESVREFWNEHTSRRR